MRVFDAMGRPASLFLSLWEGDETAVRLQVDEPRWWGLNVVTVLHAKRCPSLVGKQFQNVSDAMGELNARGGLRESGGEMRYLEQLVACVALVRADGFKPRDQPDDRLQGEPIAASTGLECRHNPNMLSEAVRCWEVPPVGFYQNLYRWVPVALIRPCAPHELSEAEARRQCDEHIRQARGPRPRPTPRHDLVVRAHRVVTCQKQNIATRRVRLARTRRPSQ